MHSRTGAGLNGRSQQLWDDLLRTERQAQEIKMETERLRQMKDEAKTLLLAKNPGLFDRAHPDAGRSESGRLSKDVMEIRHLLSSRNHARDDNNANRTLDAYVTDLKSHLKALHQRDQRNAWPEEYIPVPVDVFRRLLVEGASSSSPVPPRPASPAHHQPELPAAAAHFGRHPQAVGDDTSNDAADFSQENAASPEVPTNAAGLRTKSPAVSLREEEVASPLPGANARSPSLLSTRDEHFVMESGSDNDKLYSSGSPIGDGGGGSVADKLMAVLNNNNGNGSMSDSSTPSPRPCFEATKRGTVEVSAAPQSRTADAEIGFHSSSLARRRSGTIQLDSESDSQAAASAAGSSGRRHEEEFISGPAVEMEDEDFWN